ncbi:putative addiction module antidote protein [Saccharospirillum sp. MSK14-1]|uniref:addiction module antidote protein n=1 Tax=Saccharospirillum sp. MSK14-1 TaxID=1897632 RepID=UPI000D39F457|nr:addiction module antidote protein [Saccharospirillum sp. MSK14-1]PTY38392.1 putative addiction module antidote protein [Saccharospirillum sp. MSK14-1]
MPNDKNTFNMADYLLTPHDVYAFLNEALQTKDVSFIASAFGIVAESKGVEIIAQHTHLNCAQLCRAVSEQSEPTLASVLVSLEALQAELSLDTHGH